MARHNYKQEKKLQPNNLQDLESDKEFSKGKKAGSKRNRKSRSFPNQSKTQRGADVNINDVSWYTPNQQLLKDVASYPFGRITGYPIVQNWSSVGAAKAAINVPGVMSLYIMPTFGPTPQNVSTSPLNVASSSFFSYIRHANSGAKVYDSNDSMMYLLSVGNLIGYYSFLVRAYGIATNFENMNKYTPEALMRSMQIDFADIMTHLADFRAGINVLAYKMQSLVIPKGISYIDRMVFLYENIFMDSENAKAQYYLYNPAGFYQYSEGDKSISVAGALSFKPLRAFSASSDSGLLTHTQLLDYANELLNPILGSQDFNEFIAGDILKAFSDAQLYVVPSVAETYQVTPTYNKEILQQIENAVLFNGDMRVFSAPEYVADNTSYPRLIQRVAINSSTLEFQGALPLFALSSSATARDVLIKQNLNYDNHLMNFHHEATPEDVMIGSRLMAGGYEYSKTLEVTVSGSKQYAVLGNLHTVGSEVVINAVMYFYQAQGANLNNFTLVGETIAMNGLSNINTILDQAMNRVYYPIMRLSLLSKFDWCPRSRQIIYDDDTETNPLPTMVTDFIWDLDNFTTMSDSDLEQLHEIAMLGEFTCRNMGSFSPK